MLSEKASSILWVILYLVSPSPLVVPELCMNLYLNRNYLITKPTCNFKEQTPLCLIKSIRLGVSLESIGRYSAFSTLLHQSTEEDLK